MTLTPERLAENQCMNCGADRGVGLPPSTPTSRCGKCPPHRCDGCGQRDSHARPCACWVSLDGMPLADLKSLFARDGLSINTNGK